MESEIFVSLELELANVCCVKRERMSALRELCFYKGNSDLMTFSGSDYGAELGALDSGYGPPTRFLASEVCCSW